MKMAPTSTASTHSFACKTDFKYGTQSRSQRRISASRSTRFLNSLVSVSNIISKSNGKSVKSSGSGWVDGIAGQGKAIGVALGDNFNSNRASACDERRFSATALQILPTIQIAMPASSPSVAENKSWKQQDGRRCHTRCAGEGCGSPQ